MTNGTFDDIRDILRQTAERQLAFQEQQNRTQQQLDQLARSQEESQRQLTEFRSEVNQEFQQQAEELVGFLSSLAHDLDTLNSNVNAFIAQSTSFLASEQRDRAEFRQQMVGLQTETRNILRELADLRRQQQGNGS